MEVEFRLTPEDLIALQRYHKKHPPIRLKPPPFPLARLLFWVVVGVVVLSLMFLRDIVDDPVFDNLFATFPGVGVGVALGLVGLLLYAKLTVPNAMRRSLEQSRNAEKVLSWRRISIEPRALKVEMEYSSLTYLWWGVDAIAASEDHAFIYFMTNSAFIVPRDAFRTDGAFDEFVEAARRYHGMAGVGDAVREVIGESDQRERPRPTGVQAPAGPGDVQPEEGIVPRTAPGERRDEGP